MGTQVKGGLHDEQRAQNTKQTQQRAGRAETDNTQQNKTSEKGRQSGFN